MFHLPQVLVRVKAFGVNPVDTYIRSGSHSVKPPLPYTPGNDAAGIVDAVGDAVTTVKPGDRVYTTKALSGSHAAMALIDAAHVHPLPDAFSFAEVSPGDNTPPDLRMTRMIDCWWCSLLLNFLKGVPRDCLLVCVSYCRDRAVLCRRIELLSLDYSGTALSTHPFNDVVLTTAVVVTVRKSRRSCCRWTVVARCSPCT